MEKSGEELVDLEGLFKCVVPGCEAKVRYPDLHAGHCPGHYQKYINRFGKKQSSLIGKFTWLAKQAPKERIRYFEKLLDDLDFEARAKIEGREKAAKRAEKEAEEVRRRQARKEARKAEVARQLKELEERREAERIEKVDRVLDLLELGKTRKEISDETDMSVAAIREYLRHATSEQQARERRIEGDLRRRKEEARHQIELRKAWKRRERKRKKGERLKKIAQYRQEGLSHESIARKLGVCATTVRRYAKELFPGEFEPSEAAKPKPQPQRVRDPLDRERRAELRAERLRLIVGYMERGWTQREIGEELGISDSYVSEILRRGTSLEKRRDLWGKVRQIRFDGRVEDEEAREEMQLLGGAVVDFTRCDGCHEVVRRLVRVRERGFCRNCLYEKDNFHESPQLISAAIPSVSPAVKREVREALMLAEGDLEFSLGYAKEPWSTRLCRNCGALYTAAEFSSSRYCPKCFPRNSEDRKNLCEFIVECIEKGLTHEEIGKVLDLPFKVIRVLVAHYLDRDQRRRVRKYRSRVKKKSRQRNQRVVDLIIDYIEQGRTYKEIGAELGMSKNEIDNCFRYHATPDQLERRKRFRERSRKKEEVGSHGTQDQNQNQDAAGDPRHGLQVRPTSPGERT